jgi:hypothetical protein
MKQNYFFLTTTQVFRVDNHHYIEFLKIKNIDFFKQKIIIICFRRKKNRKTK